MTNLSSVSSDRAFYTIDRREINSYKQIAKDTSLQELMKQASKKRDEYWGKVITYSKKVFVPLTNMCRDTCGYCTFVKHPDDPEAKIMSPQGGVSICSKSGKKRV
ncbi:MAG: hypothetical protein CM15mP98_03990 [Paracoccaceae bacterium]|nr:MAG: hypothetical protein CM15mP98_03990 [Paracoccaceae bacterium]